MLGKRDQFSKSINLVKALGFHPQIDSFNYENFDADSLRLLVMDCVGALICLQKKCIKFDIEYTKRRVFWQSLMQVASFAENDVQLNQTDEALSTVLESFPDEQKVADGRSWLPLHFAVLFGETNPDNISALFISNPEIIHTGSDSRLINPCHLFSMSSSANPNLMVLRQLKIHHSRMGQSITCEGNTPLHLAARHSNSVALIKELIQIHPPALRMLNNDGKTPFCLVFKNTTSMAPNILRAFLGADPELSLIRNIQRNDELPIHCCLESGVENFFRRSENLIFLELLSILLESNNDLVNIPTSQGLLPIHIAASCSTVEVMQMLFKYSSSSSMNAIAPGWWGGTVAHIAVWNQRLDILKCIHAFNPEFLLMPNNNGWTPLHCAVCFGGTGCDFIKDVYALEPNAISKVLYY
jgi:ankyrin repeat protein